MSVFSTCLMRRLMGSAGYRALRLKSQSVERSHPKESAPSSAPSLGRRSDLLFGYAGLNWVPSCSMACMMIAKRRASAIRTLPIVDRLAVANAQSLSFNAGL